MSGLMKRRGSNSSAESGSRDNSPLASPLASRKNKDGATVTESKDASPVPSPLTSPSTARRALPKEGEVPAGESSVRAKLNLLEERLKGEFGGSRVIKSQAKEPPVKTPAAEPEVPAVVPVRGEEEQERRVR